MSFLKNKIVRVYRTEKLEEEIPSGVSVEYAHPKYFAQPKRSVDFIITERFDIEAAYKKVGITAIQYLGEVFTTPEQDNAEDVVVVEATTEESTVEDVVEDSFPELTPEDITDEEESVEPVSHEQAIEGMRFGELKGYVKSVTGTSPKNKAEAYELLGLEL